MFLKDFLKKLHLKKSDQNKSMKNYPAWKESHEKREELHKVKATKHFDANRYPRNGML